MPHDDQRLADANARMRGHASNAAWMLDSIRRRGQTHRGIAESLRECGYAASATAYTKLAEEDEADVVRREAAISKESSR